jgi:hypothetical protein
MSLRELAFGSLVYVVEEDDCAVVPSSREGERVGKPNFLG